MHLADVEGSARLVTYRAAFADWRCVCGEVGGRIPSDVTTGAGDCCSAFGVDPTLGVHHVVQTDWQVSL